jgi:hypothetical protein
MASSKKTAKKEPKATAPKQRRGSAKKGSTPTRLPPEQLETPGTEVAKVDVLERLGRELIGHEADQKASADQKKATQKRIAIELRKLPPEYGCKYRIKPIRAGELGRLLEVNVVDRVTAKASAKTQRKKKPKPDDPKANAKK